MVACTRLQKNSLLFRMGSGTQVLNVSINRKMKMYYFLFGRENMITPHFVSFSPPDSEMDKVLSSLQVPLLALGSFFIGAAIVFGILLCRGKR